jgi:hypothetical protein
MNNHFYICARIRDESGNRMPIAASIGFYVGDRCLAWFHSTSYDYELLDQYGTYGSSFLVFAGQHQLRVLKHRFSYSTHQEIDKLDRFDLDSFTFAELLRQLYYSRDERRRGSIQRIVEREQQKNGPAHPLSPTQLASIIAQS